MEGLLHAATRCGRVQISSKTFYKVTHSKLVPKFLDWPLTLWTRCGQVGVVKLLLAKGEFVDAKDEEGDTPLHKAAGQALESLCSLLILLLHLGLGNTR